MLAVFKKDFKSSMYGMTGPLFIFAVLLILGFFTMWYMFLGGTTHFEYAIVDGAFWSLLLTPILTMRSFSEERKTRTDQLLYSLPITTTQIVLGKYLAMVAVFAIPCAVTCLYPLIAAIYAGGGINFAICYGAILAYFLLGCALIAIGMGISSIFESQVLSAIVSLADILSMYFIATIEGTISTEAWIDLIVLIAISISIAGAAYKATKNLIITAGTGVVLVGASVVVYFIDESLCTAIWEGIMSAMCIFRPITSFANNVFDISCFIYYLSAAAFFVFITIQSFEKRRWN